jgi:hypothetical protein
VAARAARVDDPAVVLGSADSQHTLLSPEIDRTDQLRRFSPPGAVNSIEGAQYPAGGPLKKPGNWLVSDLEFFFA